MTKLSAYREIKLEYGGHAVFLRPSLRVATHLEQLHGGFPELMQKIAEFDTLTVWHVINAAGGRAETDALFGYAATQPLSGFARSAQGKLFELVAALLPNPADDAPKTSSQPLPWSVVFQELYKQATGWLGWPPEVAWNATPQEIIEAMDGHIASLKAVHGSGEDDKPKTASNEQQAQIIEQGFDPEFDRAALHSLKGQGKV